MRHWKDRDERFRKLGHTAARRGLPGKVRWR